MKARTPGHTAAVGRRARSLGGGLHRVEHAAARWRGLRAAPVLLALALLAPAGAAEPPVYRCGNTYQQVPCPEGRTVEVGDIRSTAQRREAERTAAAEQKAAAALAAENQAREHALKPQRRAVGVVPVAAAASAASAPAEGHATHRKRNKTDPLQATGKTLYTGPARSPGKPADPPTDTARMPSP